MLRPLVVCAVLWLVPGVSAPARAAGDADSVAYFAPVGVRVLGRPVTVYGDVRLTTLHASPLPPGRADGATAAHENDARLRGGVRWAVDPRVEFAAGVAFTPSAYHRTAAERRALVRLDGVNESAEPWALDRLALTAQAGGVTVRAGQAPLPLEASSLVWDPDLRPLGASAGLAAQTATFDVLRLTAGYWAARHVNTDDVRLAAAETHWAIREGAARGADLAVSALLFAGADSVVRAGLARQNRVISVNGVPSRLSTRYRLAVARVGARAASPAVSGAVRLDVARNLSAHAERDAARASLVLADAGPRARVELGLAYQSVEREAVLGAFASDEWWFRSRMTGGEAWCTVRPSGATSVRLAATREQRGGAPRPTKRLELTAAAALP